MKKFVITSESGMEVNVEIKDCDVGFSWNIVNCRCELKKATALIVQEECDVAINDMIENKTVTLIKK